MDIRVVTHHSLLAESVSRALRGRGHAVSIRSEAVFDHVLRYGANTELSTVTEVVEALKPLLPAVQRDESLTDTHLELRMGEAKPFSQWEVKIHAESESLGDRLRTRATSLGFRDDGMEIQEPDRSLIKFGGATPFARQVVRWTLAEEGIVSAEKKEWGDDDDDIWIYARDPAFVGKTAKQRYPVEIHGDDYERMFALRDQLGAAGFEQVSARSLDAVSSPRFSLAVGPFSRDSAIAEELGQLVRGFLEGQGVDAERFPLAEDLEGGAGGHARIDLPLAALDGGTLRPYAGAWPDRWEVVIRTGDTRLAQEIQEQLADNGFAPAALEPLPSTVFGFAIRWGAAEEYPEVTDFLRGLVESILEHRELSGTYPLSAGDTLGSEDNRIILELPLPAAERMSFEERLEEAAAGWELTLKGPRPDLHEGLQAALKELPWKSFDTETESEATPEIQYGGAPVQLVEHVRDLVASHTGIRLPLSKDWGDADDDIWIHLPRESTQVTVEGDEPLELDTWLRAGWGPTEARPLVDVQADRVRIGPITLRRRGDGERSLVPRPELFLHYCLDERTAQTLVHVAESVVLREPCLLEGETSVSKTSIIQYLAMLTGQPLARLNLNGQTDTGELVGRYVPQDTASALPVDPSELLAAAELLESESRMVLERAAHEGRNLSRVEVQQIMANERMAVHPWRWQDGLVVTAMKKGWWIVLDELNLAEPQILERLNPVLERHPSLVLTEHDNSLIGSGGHPVHPDFRIFATMNPAEYAGRSPLSPAYRDRWRAYRLITSPGEAEYHSMLRFLVHGVQPEVSVAGETWLGGMSEAPLPALAQVEGIDPFLRALARFHAALEEAVGRRGGSRGGQLGARRRERYVFTRRSLLSVMDYLASIAAPDGGSLRSMRHALARYYLARVAPGADQRVVARLLDAAGIGPSTWAPERVDVARDEDGEE